MEIITLLKANIRRRKGTFISIVILMFIISMALTLIFSIRKSCDDSLNDAYSCAKSADVTVMLKDALLTDEMRQKLDNEAIIDHYTVTPTAVISYGIDSPKVSNKNSCFFTPLTEGIKLVNEECNGYAEKIPPLSKGEIYLSYGSKSKFKCNIGDKVTAHTISGDYDLTVKGFVVEPMFGAMVIGWKWQFISQEDFDMIMAANAAENSDDHCGTGYIVQIYKPDDCTLSDGKFRRQVNLDTDIISNAWGSMTKDTSTHYTNIYSDIIMGILLVFILILATVVLIVMGHSISTGIEMDHTNLGILKSQGFGNSKIRISILLQYLIAEVIGGVLGIFCGLPLIGIITSVFDTISGCITETHPALCKTLLYLLAIIEISVVFIIITTHKVCKISPIRAISGGRNEIYFDSRIKLPISAKLLSPTLAVRQFTSAKRRYAASVIIAAILVSFMLMSNALSAAINSRKAGETMGIEVKDVIINFNEMTQKDQIDDIMETVKEYDPIHRRYVSLGTYISLNGEEIYCRMDFYPEDIITTKGRAPKYDNEIVITEMVADEFDLKLGDIVKIAKFDNHKEFVICGIYQSMADTGMSTSITEEAGESLGLHKRTDYCSIMLEDETKAEEIKTALENKYGDTLKVTLGKSDDENKLIESAIEIMRLIIYSFSMFFALVVVSMVSSKAFTQEKTDIGIFKSQGFTTGKLRLQFAVRFLIVSILGALLGTLMCSLFMNKLLTFLLKGIGVTNFYTPLTPASILIPAAAICVCFFLFALLVSRKIKKVGIRQLITE
ncbi:MacB-like core domain-containing protein [Ruminococcus flavefaciens]|uniref:MacB-like core domain-containing protein n=1 Tax=Ruminococcus flavefaciens TaxID=1265 RepID=A0A1H6I8T6_RUMFL|nr:FtsX-like permease family protein [Ruminococcus flavefaciens]SEH42795.1 MacB-like core domain-containing protein [Ruminococcus flavefaciens]